jgi:hypothetical protein
VTAYVTNAVPFMKDTARNASILWLKPLNEQNKKRQ